MDEPWKEEAFAEFLNNVEEISEKYGWNVAGYNFEANDLLDVTLVSAIGSDAHNRQF